MESKFGKNIKSGTSKSSMELGGYGWKTKTGTKKTKLKSPKIKTPKPALIIAEAKPRKSKERMDRVPSSSRESTQELIKSKNDAIPVWVRESSEKKPARWEWEESKLQWRKETKKSQRSFSKNKERDYIASKPKYEITDEKSRKPFWNTFEKKQPSEWNERKSSWDKNSVKPGTGFEKSKTGYKWVGSAWDKSIAPIKTTRKWDMPNENRDKESIERKKFSKPSFEKNITKTEIKKPKYTPPKPTWEKENTKIDKKKLIDPTK